MTASHWKIRLACAAGLLVLGAGALLMHSQATDAGEPGRPFDPKEIKPMLLTDDKAVSGLPPIDRAAPAKTAPATFAMG